MFGINLLKGYAINVHSSSLNLIKELEQYKWKVNKNGDSLNVPIDDYNHAIDALRYVIMHKFSKKGYALTGHHEIMLPLLFSAVAEGLGL